MTLYTALTTVIKLAAPMIPFMTEAIYQNLVLNSEKMHQKAYIFVLILLQMKHSLIANLKKLWT